MATGYALLDRPQRVRQYNRTRRGGTRPSGVIDVHTFESFPDWVGHDTGVENAIEYLFTRTDYGSYHSGVDSDSTIRLLPWQMEAFHDRFTNPHSVGVSIATQAHKWGQAPRAWRERAVTRAAREAARIADEMHTELGIDVPARWLTQAQAHGRMPGFVRHGTSDPGRRSDPWPAGASEGVLFLAKYRAARTNGQYAGDGEPDSIEGEVMGYYKDRNDFETQIAAAVWGFVSGVENTLPDGAKVNESMRQIMHAVRRSSHTNYARHDRVLAELAALRAEVSVLAASQGLDPAELGRRVDERVDAALAELRITRDSTDD